MTQTNSPSRATGNLSRSFIVIAVAAVMTGCTVTPQALTPETVQNRVKEDTSLMHANQEPFVGPVSMEEAVARALKYNLDFRLKKLESAVAFGLTDAASFDMLPQMVASAGYRSRSNDTGGYSAGILDGVRSENPTTSDARSRSLRGIEFSWNALDFGVSYYRARQQGDQFMIAEERRRKVVQNLFQDVRAAYWRALGAQRLVASADQIIDRANEAIERSRQAEANKLVSPRVALTYQRNLLDSITLLNQRRQDLEFAKYELAALMNVAPGSSFTLAEAQEYALPAAPSDLSRLEELSLLQRPELREEDFRKRITAVEAKKQLLNLLPGISLDYGRQYDSSSYLFNNTWSDGGVSVAWNLMRLASFPTVKAGQEFQEQADQARRMALSMAILTQTRVSAERYRMALADLEIAKQAAQVDARLAIHTKAMINANLDTELEGIRTQVRAMLGRYQRANAYANAHIAFGRLYNSVGFDPIQDNSENADLGTLTNVVHQHLKASTTDAFKLSSNLFGGTPAVKVILVGIDDRAQHARIKALASELLAARNLAIDEVAGEPLTMTFHMERKYGLDEVSWTLSMADASGENKQTRYAIASTEGSPKLTHESSLRSAFKASFPDSEFFKKGV